MNFQIISVNRNVETVCECGSICEKISFDVTNDLGDSFTYGSSCIKSVLGIDTKNLKTKRGCSFLNLDIAEYFPKTRAHKAYYKALRVCGGTIENTSYKVVASSVFVYIDETPLDINSDKTSIYYKIKCNSKQLKLEKYIQSLTVGSVITEKELSSI